MKKTSLILTKLFTALIAGLVLFNCIAPIALAQSSIYHTILAPFYDPNTTGTDTCSSSASSSDSSTAGPVYFVGDSLTAGMRDYGNLEQKLKAVGLDTVQIEATVGDSVSVALPKIKADAPKIAQAKTVVVGLGTNPADNQTAKAGSFTDDIKNVISAVKAANANTKIYWTNAYKDAPGNAYAGINTDIANQSGSLGYQVIDWNSEAGNNSAKYNFETAMHLHPGNYAAMSDFIVSNLASGSSTTTSESSGCACSTSSSDLTGSVNAEKVWNYLIGKGLTPNQVAGIMGNMLAEAHFEPRLVEYGWPNSRGETSVQNQPSSLDDNVPPDVGPQGQPGYGIIQWTSPGRKQGLRDKASSTGLKASDLGLQLDYLWQELNSSYADELHDIKASSTYQDATYIFLSRVEVPGGIDTQKPLREKYARQILETYGNDDIPSPTTVSATCGDAGSGGTPGSIGDQTKDSSQIPCAAGTKEVLAEYIAHQNGLPIKVRLCKVLSIQCTNLECNGGWGIPLGPGGFSVVNSQVSGAWANLGEKAKKDGVTLISNSSLRTYEHQGALCRGEEGGPNPHHFENGRCISDSDTVASQGNSPHESGTANDLNIPHSTGASSTSCAGRASQPNDPVWAWMKKNASSFGILQYSYESWHWDTNPGALNNRCA